MNTSTALPSRSSDEHLPLHLALEAMREELSLKTPSSLRLFDMFEPWLLEWANNRNVLTSQIWLAARWRVYFAWRLDEILEQLQIRHHPRNRDPHVGTGAREGCAQIRELVSAFTSHFIGRHRRRLVNVGREAGVWVTGLVAAVIFLAFHIIGVDLGDRFFALMAAN